MSKAVTIGARIDAFGVRLICNDSKDVGASHIPSQVKWTNAGHLRPAKYYSDSTWIIVPNPGFMVFRYCMGVYAAHNTGQSGSSPNEVVNISVK